MKYRPILLFLVVTLLRAPLAIAGELPMATPESQGVSSAGVLALVNAMESEIDSPHGLVLVRHGKIIAQGWWSPYDSASPHMLYSLSKSFTSTAVGFAVAEGKLSVDDKVLSFFPDDAPANPSDNLKAMRVRDLLTMTAGHAKDTLPALTQGKDDNWPKVFLSLPVEHEPGTHFLYNTGATYMCSAIIRKVTGQTVLEYLTPRLFEPLGIKGATWEPDPRGTSVGGWGLKITTNDIVRFGQLYLQKGVWNGKRLLPEAWIDEATRKETPNGSNPQSDWNQGYGYQFWRCRHNAYRGDGAFGQFCIVMPEQDMVLAITAGQGDMQKTLNLVWQHLLPAVHDGALSADDASEKQLTAKLTSLSFPTARGEATSPLAAKVTGKTFTLADNNLGLKSVSFDFADGARRIVIQTAAGEQRYDLGAGAWRKQVIAYHKFGIPIAATTGPQPVAASGAWPADDEFAAIAWCYESPFRVEMSFKFDADKGTLAMKYRVHPLQGQPTTIAGTLK